jgi:hypothetical protein
MDHVSQRKKKPFHDSRVLKKQFHGKLDSNKNYNNNRFIKSMFNAWYSIYALSSLTSLPVS